MTNNIHHWQPGPLSTIGDAGSHALRPVCDFFPGINAWLGAWAFGVMTRLHKVRREAVRLSLGRNVVLC